MDSLDTKLVGKTTVKDLICLIEHQKDIGETIKFHPNGFLQLELSSTDHRRAPGLRFHIWTDSIPPRRGQKFQTHDHIFDIDSYVLSGAICNVVYKVAPDENGGYCILEANAEGQLEPTGGRISCAASKTEIITSGSTYHIHKGDFHSSSPRDTFVSTLIYKNNTDFSLSPKIVAPLDDESTALITDRTLHQGLAWEVVEIAKEKIMTAYK